jgi:uncharacterized membrane protein
MSAMAIFTILLGVVGIYLWLEEQKLAGRVFDYAPPILLIFITCMILGNVGILPHESEAYSWTKKYLMPFAIFLFMISVNIRAIFKLGRLVTIMVVSGMLSVTFGFVAATVLFSGQIGLEAWSAIIASYAGAIGGSQNLVAMAETFNASPGILGALIAVDSIIGYSFLALLIYFASYKTKFDGWLRAREGTLELVQELSSVVSLKPHPVSSGGLAMIVFLGFAVTLLCRFVGDFISAQFASITILAPIVTLVLVVTTGLLLSLSPVKQFNEHGTTQVAKISLYLMMAVLGAGASIEHVWEYRIFLIYSPVLLLISLVTMLLIGRYLRAPMVLVITGLYANLGGTVTNPILAAAYDKGFVTVALMMAIFTQIMGMYVPLLLAPVIHAILS